MGLGCSIQRRFAIHIYRYNISLLLIFYISPSLSLSLFIPRSIDIFIFCSIQLRLMVLQDYGMYLQEQWNENIKVIKKLSLLSHFATKYFPLPKRIVSSFKFLRKIAAFYIYIYVCSKVYISSQSIVHSKIGIQLSCSFLFLVAVLSIVFISISLYTTLQRVVSYTIEFKEFQGSNLNIDSHIFKHKNM